MRKKARRKKNVVGYGQSFEIPLFDPLQRAIRSVLQIAFAHTRLKNTIFLAYFFVRPVVFLSQKSSSHVWGIDQTSDLLQAAMVWEAPVPCPEAAPDALLSERTWTKRYWTRSCASQTFCLRNLYSK